MNSTNNHLQQCEKGELHSLFWRSSVLQRTLFIHVSRILSLLLNKLSVLVRKDLPAGLAALSQSATANARIFIGLALMGVVSPLSACTYMLFDRTVIDLTWYHLNYFHLFFLLGPHLFQFFCVVGAFMLFPQGSKRAYLLIAPTGFILAKIIWLYQVDSNNELWAVVPSSLILISVLISAVLLLTIDFLTWRQFHRMDAFEKRLEGLYKISKDIPNDKLGSMFKTTWREKRDFQKEY